MRRSVTGTYEVSTLGLSFPATAAGMDFLRDDRLSGRMTKKVIDSLPDQA